MEAEFLPVINKAKKDRDVLAVAIFGSYARKENHRDIDICLFLQSKASNLETSKKKLEYIKIAKNKFDIQIFQQLPLYIRHRILKEGKIVLCKDEDKLYDIAIHFAKEYEDFRPLYKSYMEAVAHG